MVGLFLNDKLERTWKWSWSTRCSISEFAKRDWGKPWNNDNIRCPGRDSNYALPEYESRELPLSQPARWLECWIRMVQEEGIWDAESFRSRQSLSYSKNFPTYSYYGTRRFISLFTRRARHWPVSWARWLKSFQIIRPRPCPTFRNKLLLFFHGDDMLPPRWSTTPCQLPDYSIYSQLPSISRDRLAIYILSAGDTLQEGGVPNDCTC
jgi:hypothetical protein